MNALGCDTWARTDQLLLTGNPQGTCEAPILGYALWSAFLILARIFLLGNSWRFWLKRFANQKGRIPFQPLFFTITTIIQILFLILGGVDVISAEDGTASFLYGLWAAFYFVQGLFIFKKVVSLGTKMAFLGPARSQGKGLLSNDGTTNFDLILKILIFFQVVACTVSIIFLCIIGFIAPGQRYPLQVGYASSGTFMALLSVSIIWQLERCIHVIKSTSFVELREDDALNEAIQRMRIQQGIFFLLVLPEVVLHFLHAADVLPLYWYLVLIHASTDVLIMTSFAIVFSARKIFRKKQPASKLQIEPTSGVPKSTTG